jgi:inorganic pyrophosphatase
MPEFHHFRPHPWHGLEPGPEPPSIVHAFVEITPFDLIKYEVDKATGYLRVDRPQRTSSLPPSLYGFIPRTYCGERVGRLMPGASHGDRDPLDVCVLSERPIARAEVLLAARVVGGLPMLDHGEADDKIVAVLVGDLQWGAVRELEELPAALIDRLRHYFATYKTLAGQPSSTVVGPAYGREHAETVIGAAIADYQASYAALEAPHGER